MKSRIISKSFNSDLLFMIDLGSGKNLFGGHIKIRHVSIHLDLRVHI